MRRLVWLFAAIAASCVESIGALADDEMGGCPSTVAASMNSPAWTAESNQSSAWFGVSVGSAGDVNGDGYADVVVGANFFDNGEVEEGRAFVYHGTANGLEPSPAWTAESDQVNAQFAVSVAGAGDVNGDGFSDVIIGAYGYDNGQDAEGRVYVYLGSKTGLESSAGWVIEGDQAGAELGWSVACAGDVNDDGYADVIVGAGGFDNPQPNEGRAYLYLGSASGLGVAPAWTVESDQPNAFLGNSVAGAGDINGDGYSDVIVGAYLHSDGEFQEGRALVFHGSSSGLASSAAWAAESNQVQSYFGNSVSGAGDVNGDGYADVIVGAWSYDNGQVDEGRAYVYLGSSSGLGTSAAWTAEGEQPEAFFGASVASAGDVDEDGYSDVIIGAFRYHNGEADEGQSSVYHGSATGLSPAAAWAAESDQSGAQFGVSVGGAGDVNNDGYADVIVGAWGYDGGQVDEGRAYAYLGGAGGLIPLGACCRASGECALTHAAQCQSPDEFQGEGSVCIPDGCPPPVGACCLLAFCTAVSEATCQSYHGSYQGDGEPCVPMICETSGADVIIGPADMTPRSVPNPSLGTSRIYFWLPESAPITVRVFGASGRAIRTLHDGPHAAGAVVLPWDGRDDAGREVPSGIYLTRVDTAVGVTAGRVTVAR